MVPINYFAVIAGMFVMMALGFLWYGPLFGKQWLSLMGWDPEAMHQKKEGMAKLYAINALGALLMSFVLAHSLVFASTYLNISGVSAGLQAGFWNWLGFIMPIQLGSVLWDGKPLKLFFINTSYYLLGLLLVGLLLAFWI